MYHTMYGADMRGQHEGTAQMRGACMWIAQPGSSEAGWYVPEVSVQRQRQCCEWVPDYGRQTLMGCVDQGPCKTWHDLGASSKPLVHLVND